MAPPRLGDEQINCGPWFNDEQVAGRWISRTTPFGDYDVAALAATLPADQQPDVVVCHVDCGFCLRPRNLHVFAGPKVLLAADSHWGDHAVSAMVRYATSEPFDRTILLYDRHHADIYRAAGVRNLHWIPGLTFTHPDARIESAVTGARGRHLALVGKTGYHFRRQRLFAGLISAGLPLAWRELPQREVPGFYGSSLIGLNVAMNGDLNLRVFETIAGGAMLLTDRLAPASGLDELLAEGREKVSYDHADHLVELARHYLAHPEEAEAIGRAGRQWFQNHFGETRRRDAFRELVFDGRERPEFALPPPPVARVFLSPAKLEEALVAYDFINERHRHQETVAVRIDGQNTEFAAWLRTLPRVQLADAATPTSASFAPVPGAPGVTVAIAYPVTGAASPSPARARLDTGDVGGALPLAQAALKTDPRSLDNLLVLAEIAREGGNLPLAQKVLANARQIAPDAPGPVLLAWSFQNQRWPRQPQRLLAAAWRAFERLDLGSAGKLATLALQLTPDTASAHFLLGQMHARQLAQASSSLDREAHATARLQHLVRAHELAPELADYACALGLASRDSGQIKQAVLAYRRALALDPTLTAASLGLGEACLELADFSTAAEVFAAGLTHAPEHGMLQNALAVAREQLASAELPFARELFAWSETRSDLTTARYDSRWRAAVLARGGLGCTRDLAADNNLPAGESLRLLLGAFTLAPAVTASLTDHPHLPPRRVVMSFQPWFNIDTREVVRRGFERDLLTVLFDPQVGSTAPFAPALDASDWTTLTHRQINLYAVTVYRIALELRLPPAAIDARTPEHLAIIRTFFGEAVALIDRAESFLNFYRPDTVVIAQGHELADAVLRQLAVHAGLRVVALENILHRDRLLWDDVSGLAVNRNLSHNAYWRYSADVPHAVAERTAAIFLATLPALKSAEHRSPHESALPPVTAGTRTITYLAQVGNDSSVLFGLRGFSDQAEVIAVLADYAATHRHRLVIKLHPKESPAFRHDAPYYRELTASWLDRHEGLQRARESLGDLLFIDADNTSNTYELIRAADICVTINSQAGLEAALLGKEVVLCGRSFYGGLGFTHDADDADTLALNLTRVLERGVMRNDGVSARRFFHIFTELYCRPKSVETVLRLMAGPMPWPAVSPIPPSLEVQTDLAYDVGMNNGDDTAHYLAQGFRVVAIEADPELCAQARSRFDTAIADGRLTIVNVGITRDPGVMNFWICEEKREWNSFDRKIASRDGLPHHAIPVPCQTFGWVLRHFGMPQTLKIDIEGHDRLCVEALADFPTQPAYLSVELGNIDEFINQLGALGYDGFKCISQFNHQPLELDPAVGSPLADTRDIPPGASGPIGEDTPGAWLNADEARRTYHHFKDACARGESSPYWYGKAYSFWVDLHARHRNAVRQSGDAVDPVNSGSCSVRPSQPPPPSELVQADTASNHA